MYQIQRKLLQRSGFHHLQAEEDVKVRGSQEIMNVSIKAGAVGVVAVVWIGDGVEGGGESLNGSVREFARVEHGCVFDVGRFEFLQAAAVGA